MSLINEALRKARQEAADQEAEERAASGVKGKAVYREPRAHLPESSKMGTGLIVGLLLGVLAAGGGGLGVWWLTARDSSPIRDSRPATEHTQAPAPDPALEPATTQAATTQPATTQAATTQAEERASRTEPSVPTPPTTPESSKPTSSNGAQALEPPAETESGRRIEAQEESPSEPSFEPPSEPPPEKIAGMEASRADPNLPKLIEPPETIGQIGDSNTFVLEADLGDGKVTLDFIVWNPSAPFAQINGKQVEVGQLVAGLLVEKIERDQVTLKATDGRIVLRVR